MSDKNLDHKGRWRNLTIAFRVSPEENEEINRRVRLSGLTKQEYITRRCQDQSVVIVWNPRVYKALKQEMAQLRQAMGQLQVIEAEEYNALMERFRLVETVYEGMGEHD